MGKFCVAITAILAFGSAFAVQSARAQDNPAARCTKLAHADFSKVLDAPTTIEDSSLVAASGDLPAYCQIDGHVAPQVGFRIQLPTDKWNGKFLQIGCGGFCGTDFKRFDAEHSEKAAPVMSCIPALRKGYACIRTDEGHKGGLDGIKWAYNNPGLQIDYGFRATHVTTLAGKAITQQFYSKAPAKSYFVGCSDGGLQGLSEAQRFPWDYDGIVSGAAPVGGLTTKSLAAEIWTYNVTHDAAGKPLLDPKDILLLHRKVIDKCDADDGLKDGLIGDPRTCKFDPDQLVCKAGQTSDCLSRDRVDVIKKVYSGPTAPAGAVGFAGEVFGSELGWLRTVSGQGFVNQGAEGLRYLFLDQAPGPGFNLRDFDITRDYKRFGIDDSLVAADNPDLRRFKAAGGKLLTYVGWADRSRPLVDIDYYETVSRVMGGLAKTQDFYRLFVLPGVGHCFGGEGPDKVDYLGALEAWVEKGHAPDMLIATKLKPRNPPSDFSYIAADFPVAPSDVAFTRPLYPYPTEARYKGVGDPNKAENFGPVAPK